MGWLGAVRLALTTLALPTLLVTSGWAAAPASDAIRLDAAQAHDPEYLLKRLKRADARTYRRFVAAYDDYVARHPDDAAAGLARCHFIEQARYDEEVDEYSPNEDEYEDCLTGLEARFPDDAAVVLAGLENTWGDEGLRRAKELTSHPRSSWRNEDTARAYKHLARLHGYRDEIVEAGLAADMAVLHDPSLDLSLMVGRYWQHKGNREEALKALTPYLDRPAESWELNQKAKLLADLQAYDLAATVYARLTADPEASVDHLGYGKVLESLGDLSGAREQYVAATDGTRHEERAALGRLFLLDLAHADAATAAAAYERFRDAQDDAEKSLPHRLQLAWKHPTIAWSMRDLPGLRKPMTWLAGGLVVPLLFLVPIHYVGLVRRQRRPDAVRETTRWGLRDCWFVAASLAWITTLASYTLIASGALTSFADGSPVPPAAYAAIGRTLWIATLAMALSLCVVVRPSDLRLLMPTRWSVARSILVPFAIVAAFHVVVWGLAGSFGTTAVDEENPFTRLIEALGTTSGLVGQIALVAIVAPFFEELAFRGILLEGFRRHLPFGWANLAQAGVFAAAHGLAEYAPLYVAVGLVAGRLTRRSGGLLAPWVLHMANNAFALFYLRTGG